MESITIDTLLSIAGIVLVTGLVVEAVKWVYPGEIASKWLRLGSMLLAVALTIVVAAAVGVEDGANMILAWVVVVINGIIAGMAASAGFDTIKYGTARVVESP